MTLLSNQYPRLAWKHNPEPVRRGFMARPHGDDAGVARIYEQRRNTDIVCEASLAEAKQAAADMATSRLPRNAPARIAYWDAVAATED